LQLAKRSTAGRPGRRSDNSGNSDNRATVVTEDRRLEVLKAIVEDFIATNEPVGSKTLADRHNLGVSPATIRNDMAALEEEGLIAQPHTSAGRVPTDAGYRLFVRPSISTMSCVAPCAPWPSSPAMWQWCSTRRCHAAGYDTLSWSPSTRPD
jgi:hypothetical protein